MTDLTQAQRDALGDALHADIDGDFLVEDDGETIALSQAGIADVVRWAVNAVAPVVARLLTERRDDFHALHLGVLAQAQREARIEALREAAEQVRTSRPGSMSRVAFADFLETRADDLDA